MKLEKETRLKLAIGLSSTFCVVEVVGGYIANSIAIYSDAAHLLTDIAGFAIALLAVVASKAPGTKHLTYGFARAEVFGALGSILSLWVITAFLLYAAYIRALKWFEGHAETVDGFFMFLVACFGVCVNICLGLVFQSEHGGAMHPSHSHCNHDHSHDGHSHGHDHGSSCDHGGSKKVKSATYHILALNDIESGRSDDHDHAHASHDDHSSCSGHGHDHGHDSHSSHGASDTTKLLSGSEKKSYNSYDDHGHDHGHDAEHDHSTCSGHGHSEHDHDHSGHDHDHDHSSGGCSGHGHDGHEHAHGHTDSASDLQKTFEPSDVNIEAAYLHVLTDLIQSIGVALAGLIIWFKPHWQIIDPLCTFIFSFIALKTTIPLLIRVFGILFEGTPSHVDWEIVKDRLSAIPGVVEVHDLHIWSISSKSVSLTVHIKAHKPQAVLKAAHKICADLSIDHATIQVQDAADVEEDFCYSAGCDSHNPVGSGKLSSCVLTNHLDSDKSPRK